MTYKLFNAILAIFFCVQLGNGQDVISPDFVATYDFLCVSDTVTHEKYQLNKFILLTKREISRFHHIHAQFNDSIVAAWERNNSAANAPDQNPFMDHFRKYRKSYAMDFWTEKNLRKNLAAASILWHIPSYHLEVSYPLPWVLDQVRLDTINGVVCRVATLDYGGRNWTAYYNTDIAIQQGPYVFSGLPGLIVRIEDERSWYRFDLSGYWFKPKGEYFWRTKYYYSYGSQKLSRGDYVDRVDQQRTNPETGPVPTTEAQLMEMKQRFNSYYWRLIEQR